jgi:hypothetical protein
LTGEGSPAGSQDTLVSQVVKLRDEYEGYLRLTDLELQDRKKLVDVIRQLQAWVGQTVTLLPGALRAVPGGVVEAHVTSDGTVVMTDSRGVENKKPLEQFDAPTFLSIIQDYTPKLQKLIQDKKRTVMEANAPRIGVRISLRGGHVLLFDWRVYRMSVFNEGSDARDLILSVRSERTQTYGPFNLRRADVAHLELRYYRRLSTLDSIPVEVSCKDGGGHEFKGSGMVKPGSEGWQEISILATQTA